MKTTLTWSLFALCFLVAFDSNAQVNKSERPNLFANYSSTIPASQDELNKAFSVGAGSDIRFKFSNNFSFSGTVVSAVKKYDNLTTALIKSAAFNGALFCISKRINDDNTITYVGRIINENYADGYELVKDNLGNYSFNKIKTKELIQDF